MMLAHGYELNSPQISQDGRIQVNAAGYFENVTAVGRELFVPVGVNYWPGSSGTLLWSEHYPRDEIRHDFETLKSSGLNTVRIFVVWESFEPTPAVYNQTQLDNLRDMVGLAKEFGLTVDVSTFVGWMSGHRFWPTWKNNRNLYTDAFMINRSKEFAYTIASTVCVHVSHLLAMEYGNEMNCCTDPAPTADIISWTQLIYDTFNKGCPGVPVVPGTDENTIIGDTNWPLGGPTGRIAGDVLNLHPYPVLFTPTKGDGLLDPLTQAATTYDVSFVRAFGPTFMQVIVLHESVHMQIYMYI